ncbi:hypothetical protein SKTS_25640 [Sulfurimicrobium lacus]|uniref:Uncharacterized protein n=1 Tax=Sulfurimicrobium lacus TaxID=2715678 RepID=A0A6F8VD80_9PROT|nr:hypothetical protein [Sulfurimicrobium lacus]BCB27678.1 hypothetical protein SKTS_25640 [Sulfurimicrobium lacus]
MDQQDKGSVLFKYLPSGRQVAMHLTAMATLSCLLGPWLGPLLVNWINPPQAWGYVSKVGDYSLLNVLLWGFAFLMFEAFIYTGWLIRLGRKSWEIAQPKSWYN